MRCVRLWQETAVQTYTQCLEELDAGQLPMWSRLAAPEIAVNYWKLAPDATMRDVIANIRCGVRVSRFALAVPLPAESADDACATHSPPCHMLQLLRADTCRADEMHHREIHHTFADLTRDGGGANPFQPGQAREHGR